MRYVISGWLLLFSFSAWSGTDTPQKIITLSPHLAELVFELGSGDHLVGVIEHSDYPAQVKFIPRIGSATGLDMERILSIKPDLILAWQGGSREVDIKKLKSLGLNVVSIKSETIEDIPVSIRDLGRLLKQQENATEINQKFEEKLRQISQQFKHSRSRQVYIEISSKPLMALTHLHPFSSGLELCGLKNIFSEAKKAAIITNMESVISAKPDTILLRSSIGGAGFNDRKKFYQIGTQTQSGFIQFNEDLAFRQTPRLLDAVDGVCSAVNG